MHTTTPSAPNLALQAQIDAACDRACQAIAPAWPLDRAIAVNPHWARIGMPVRQVAARMAVLGGIQVFPSLQGQRQAWQEGRITPQDLEIALRQVPAAGASGLTPGLCQHALRCAPTFEGQASPQLPLLIDVLDQQPSHPSHRARQSRLSWRQAITHQVSQTCAAYFDQHQADWQPERTQGLYAFWRDTLQHDYGIGILMGLPDLGRALNALPATAQDAERWVLQRLGLPQAAWADYLEAVLLSINGWASWCAYLGWQARLQGGTDPHLRELLAIRLAWGAVLLDGKTDAATKAAFGALQAAWSESAAVLQHAQHSLLVQEVWQTALEIGYQRSLAHKLLQPATQGRAPAPQVQAAFCIDVRSEPLRRALEAALPSIQTLGFAGFFGLPVDYTPLATQATRPQLPGLLAPSMQVHDHLQTPGESTPQAQAALQNSAVRARADRLGLAAQWHGSSRWPGAAFSFVEAAGAGYLGKLWHALRPSRQERARDDLSGLPGRYRNLCRPHIVGLTIDAKVALAAGVLHAMGLDTSIAPLVLLVAHGSQSVNNAQAAALDCGACCGQTGEVNVRSLAHILNDPAVRLGLQARGIRIPEHAWFVAALHNTTTDELESFDTDLLTPAAQSRWDALQTALTHASNQVRAERAPSLGLGLRGGQHQGLDPHLPPQALLGLLRQRANDAAQTRPEWGLAGNAAFVIAPRHRTQGISLAGRSFLHDYDASQDADGSVLELLMTAPMLVTHWINWQYHASTCDPARLGSGSKVLHNVVGGTIGMFEGNGGDLRIGLSRQSLHNGQRWVHEPLRLTVVIDAPAQAIEAVLAKHAAVRQLVDNGWLHLWRIDERFDERFGATRLQRYANKQWQALDTDLLLI